MSRSFRTGSRVASIAAMQRSLKPQSTGQHRGDPPSFAIPAAGGEGCRAEARKCEGGLSHPVGYGSAGHFRIRGEIYYHPPLRTESLQVGVLPDAPIPAALAQRPEALRSERRGWGWNSLTRHHFAHVVQCRDGALKTRTVPVQARPWAPSACSPMQRREAQTFDSAGASPATRTNLECPPVKRAGPVC